MSKQKRGPKKANYYTRQFDRTAANKARRAAKRRKQAQKPVKPGLAERDAKRKEARDARRKAARIAAQERERALRAKHEREVGELRESIRRQGGAS